MSVAAAAAELREARAVVGKAGRMIDEGAAAILDGSFEQCSALV